MATLADFDGSASGAFTLNSTKVATWHSTVGSLTLTRATDAERPLYNATAINGMPGVEFDGSSFWLLVLSGLGTAVTQPLTWGVVARSDSSDWHAFISAFSGAQVQMFKRNNQRLQVNNGSLVGEGHDEALITTGDPFLAVFTSNGSSSLMRLNKVAMSNASTIDGGTTLGLSTAMHIGLNVVANERLDGVISHIRIEDTALSGTALDDFENELWDKWFTTPGQSGSGTPTDVRDTASGAATGSAAPDYIPQNLVATAIDHDSIGLTWDAVAGISAYDIERDGVVIVSDHPTNSYTDNGLASSTLFEYRVRSVL